MQRTFITNLALLLALNLLIKPFWILGIEVGVQNAVGPENYGFYFSLYNFSFLFNILLDCGITNYNNKNISQNTQLLNKHLSSILVLRTFLGFSYFIVSFGIAMALGYSTKQLSMLWLLLFNQVLTSFILYLRSNIAGLHLFKTDSIISVLDRLIMIAICSVLLWGNIVKQEFRIEWFIYAQTTAYLITALFTLIIVVDKAKLKKLNFQPAFFVMILKKSYPYAVLVLLMTFYNRIDTVMLERLLPDGKYQSGVYASAYRLLDASNMIAFLFAGLLLPMFARMIKQRESVIELVKLAFSLLVVPAFVLVLVSVAYRYELMHLLYGDREHLAESSKLFGILMCCLIPMATTYIFGTLLTANGSLKLLNSMAACGMLLIFLLSFLLIPSFEMYGAAYSSLATQAITALIQVIMAYNIFKFRTDWLFLFKLLGFSIITVGMVYAIYYFADLYWTLEAALCVGVCMAVAWLMHLLKFREMLRIVKYER